MTLNQYKSVIKYFKMNKYRSLFLLVISKIFPYINAFLYIFLLIILFFLKSNMIYKVIFVPAFVFIFVSIFRKILNKPRPYDELNFNPFFNNVKRNKGKSFPSRHTASAFIISFAMLYVNIYLGIVGFILSIFIALSRIFIGVHYPKDVICAFLISAIFGFIGFYLF